jgi:6-pyruvoyltetrahydropterin/6-carboxytetrahydropterin synthase
MTVHLTRRYHFAASHRLHNEQLSEEENCRIYGKCNNPFGHGHNYGLEVTLSGPVDERTGMVCDLGELDAVVEREVLGRFDHENLNMVRDLAGLVPTSEQLAICIFNILSGVLHVAHLEKIRLVETSQNSFEYCGGE